MSFWSWFGLVDRNEIARLDSIINSLKDENKLFHQQSHKLLEDLEQNQNVNKDSVISEISNNREQVKILVQNNNDCIEQLVTIVAGLQEKSMLSQEDISEQIKECIEMLNTNNIVINEQSDKIQKVVKYECDRNREQIESEKVEVLEMIKSSSQILVQEKMNSLKEIRKYFDEINSLLNRVQEYMEMSCTYISEDNKLLKDSNRKMIELHSVSQRINEKTDNMEEIQEYLKVLSESVNHLWSITKAVWVDSILTDVDLLR